MTNAVYLDTVAQKAHAAMSGDALPSVRGKLLSRLPITGIFFAGEEVLTIDSGTGKCVIKPKEAPAGAPSLIDTTAELITVGSDTHYLFEWASADSTELRDYLDAQGDPSQPVEMRCEIEYAIDGETARIAFPISFQTSYHRPEDPAPNANEDASWEWLQDRLLAGTRVTLVVDDEAKTITINVSGAGSGGADWGDIGGTLSDQTDLQTALDGKQPLSNNLTTYAGIEPSANVQILLGAADYAAFKASLSLGNVENTALSTWAGSTNITTINATQLISRLSNLTSNGFVKTSGDDGTLIIDTSTYQPKNNNLDELSLFGSSTGANFAGDSVKLAKYGTNGELGTSGHILIFGDVAANVTTLTAQAGVNPTVALPSTTGTLALTTGNISGTAAGLSSTLAVTSGGTGQTTFTNGQLLIGNTTGSTLSKATLTAGTGVTITNGSGSITIAATAQAIGNITGLGTGIATALAVNTGSAGAPVLYNGALGTPSSGDVSNCTIKAAFPVACSNETDDLTTGKKVTFRMPYALTLTSVRINVNTAPTGSVIIVDVKEAGTSIFSTKPQIAISAFTSVGGAVPGTLSDTALADDAEITVHVDQIGSTIAGKGLKITLLGTRS